MPSENPLANTYKGYPEIARAPFEEMIQNEWPIVTQKVWLDLAQALRNGESAEALADVFAEQKEKGPEATSSGSSAYICDTKEQ